MLKFTHRYLLFTLLLLSLMVPSATWAAAAASTSSPSGDSNLIEGRRMALVFGNADYGGRFDLRNPANDAHRLAGALKDGFGFSVDVYTNKGLRTMKVLLTLMRA